MVSARKTSYTHSLLTKVLLSEQLLDVVESRRQAPSYPVNPTYIFLTVASLLVLGVGALVLNLYFVGCTSVVFALVSLAFYSYVKKATHQYRVDKVMELVHQVRLSEEIELSREELNMLSCFPPSYTMVDNKGRCTPKVLSHLSTLVVEVEEYLDPGIPPVPLYKYRLDRVKHAYTYRLFPLAVVDFMLGIIKVVYLQVDDSALLVQLLLVHPCMILITLSGLMLCLHLLEWVLVARLDVLVLQPLSRMHNIESGYQKRKSMPFSEVLWHTLKFKPPFRVEQLLYSLGATTNVVTLDEVCVLQSMLCTEEVHLPSAGDQQDMTLMDLCPDPSLPFQIRFEDPKWKERLGSLRPLAFAIQVCHNFLRKDVAEDLHLLRLANTIGVLKKDIVKFQRVFQCMLLDSDVKSAESWGNQKGRASLHVNVLKHKDSVSCWFVSYLLCGH